MPVDQDQRSSMFNGDLAAVEAAARVRLKAAERAQVELELVEAWEKLMELRASEPIGDRAAERKAEAEARHLRELMRLSLIAARG